MWCFLGKYILILLQERSNRTRQSRVKFVSDENHQENTIKALSYPLHIHGSPITRVRVKKMQAALNGLKCNHQEKIWNKNAIQDARHGFGEKKKHCGHYSSCWAAKCTIWVKLE